MGYSITSLANNTKRMAMAGLRDAADNEVRVESANKRLKQAERQQKMGGVMAGASMGAMVGGPVGAIIGAVGGLVLGGLF